jgi:hypothetical protein
MQFSETVDAYLEGRTIGVGLLVFMDFVDAPRRWWMGTRTLTTNDDLEWGATGDLISVDGLEADYGTAANAMSFTLSGASVDPELVNLARNASDRVKGRKVVVYLQFFDITPTDGGQAFRPLDMPDAIKVGRMDRMRYIADGPASRRIALTAEGLWTGRNRPPFGLFTDRDQIARHAGDRGLEQVSDLVTKTIRWPIF